MCVCVEGGELVTCICEKIVISGLAGETEGNCLLGIPKRRWENSMKLDI